MQGYSAGSGAELHRIHTCDVIAGGRHGFDRARPRRGAQREAWILAAAPRAVTQKRRGNRGVGGRGGGGRWCSQRWSRRHRRSCHAWPCGRGTGCGRRCCRRGGRWPRRRGHGRQSIRPSMRHHACRPRGKEPAGHRGRLGLECVASPIQVRACGPAQPRGFQSVHNEPRLRREQQCHHAVGSTHADAHSSHAPARDRGHRLRAVVRAGRDAHGNCNERHQQAVRGTAARALKRFFAAADRPEHRDF
mmetsp:Transcript_25991/g.72587  ORF Transcript_25991/g.72587 Transcript_25991/m.72587 type:complete len:247 (+) Transcript_25991:1178-1918(+)